MISKKAWLCVVALVVITSIIGWTVYAQNATSNKSAKVTWEYKVISHYISEQNLNELGAQGWELVLHDTGVRGGGSTSESFIFKRAK